jgi:anti-sigma regulatory factor (Ser/Thr protein kinase)
MLAEAATAETRSYIATPDRLADIDGWIEQAGSAWQLPEDVVFRARVCVAELLANLLEHGRSRRDGDDLRITLRPSPPALELEIADSGRPFDPTARAAAAVTRPVSDATGGRGLRLIGSYASDMSYGRVGRWNVLSLRVAPAMRPVHRAPA